MSGRQGIGKNKGIKRQGLVPRDGGDELCRGIEMQTLFIHIQSEQWTQKSKKTEKKRWIFSLCIICCIDGSSSTCCENSHSAILNVCCVYGKHSRSVCACCVASFDGLQRYRVQRCSRASVSWRRCSTGLQDEKGSTATLAVWTGPPVQIHPRLQNLWSIVHPSADLSQNVFKFSVSSCVKIR